MAIFGDFTNALVTQNGQQRSILAHKFKMAKTEKKNLCCDGLMYTSLIQEAQRLIGIMKNEYLFLNSGKRDRVDVGKTQL